MDATAIEIVDWSAGAGSVVGDNSMDDGFDGGTDAWVETGVNGSHMVGSHHMLFEGDETFNIDSDNTHRNHARSRAAVRPRHPERIGSVLQ